MNNWYLSTVDGNVQEWGSILLNSLNQVVLVNVSCEMWRGIGRNVQLYLISHVIWNSSVLVSFFYCV